MIYGLKLICFDVSLIKDEELTSKSGVLTSKGSSTSKCFLHSRAGWEGLSIRAFTKYWTNPNLPL